MIRNRLYTIWPVLFPLGLWILMWAGIQNGEIKGLSSPPNSSAFLQGIQASLPLVALTVAFAALASQWQEWRRVRDSTINPLGLLAVYGSVGLVNALIFSRGLVPIYWSVAYLSVPVVLIALTSGDKSLRNIQSILGANWLIMGAAMTILFVFALATMELGSTLARPWNLFDCNLRDQWFIVSSGQFRSTGVGRYAAVTGIVALSAIFHGKFRAFWTIIILMSLVMLLTSGARGSIAAFIAAVPLVVIWHVGKRAIAPTLLSVAVFAPIIWTTGLHDDFLNNCILSGWDRTQRSSLFTVPLPGDTVLSPPLAADSEATNQQPESGGRIPDGFFTFTGRTEVWKESFKLFKSAPLIGHGFQADRILLGTHAHNAVVQTFLQTGILGAIAFIAALGWGWLLLLKRIGRLGVMAGSDKNWLIQTGGLLTFFSIRGIVESSGAFFGIDLLLMAPLFIYLYLVNRPEIEVDVNPS